MITVDLLMSTKPCERWPRERVEALLARPEIDCSSWVRFAETCLAAVEAVSLADLRLTAYRAATPAQRMIGVRRSTRVRIEDQIQRWPAVSRTVARVRSDLLRWAAGEDVDLADARRALRRADAAADAADAAASCAIDAAADSSAYATTSCAIYAATDAAEAHAGLMFICGVLDGTEVAP